MDDCAARQRSLPALCVNRGREDCAGARIFALREGDGAFYKNKKALTDRDSPPTLKLRAFSQVVQSSVDNSAGAWHVTQKLLQRVQGRE